MERLSLRPPEYELKRGTLAYFNSFAGLVKCRVQEMRRDEDNALWIKVIVTHGRGYWKPYMTYETHSWHVTPREAVIVRNRQFVILPYRWKEMDHA